MEVKLGYKARYIEDVCRAFDVPYRQRGWFDLKNGYALWFPNCSEEGAKDWKNKLTNGGKTIVEMNDEKNLSDLLKQNKREFNAKRVTFAKKNDGLYHFVGVFDIDESATKAKRQMTYKRIATEYPCKSKMWLWILLALLIIGGAAAYYFMNKQMFSLWK